MTTEPILHELLQPIAFLVGDWKGDGSGLWPGGFAFVDSMAFAHDGRPVLQYRQQTQAKSGPPSHGEAGYFTGQPDGQFHVTISEPSGITEVLVGQVEEGELRLRSTMIGRAPDTDNVSGVSRRLRLEGDSLVVEVDISVNNEPLAPHTRSVLRRA